MKDTEFNLLDEPWVRVLDKEGTVKEVSLTEALLQAHEYTDLAGETPAQDVAVLRLLLAVLHTVFSRTDTEGNAVPLENEDDALERWQELWQAGQLPAKPIAEYLQQWHERFWLFHPERPFYQVPEAGNGTEYDGAKLNGEILQSGNKLRLFSSYSGEQKYFLNAAQAARWLIYTNAFDDTSAKPKKTNSKEKFDSVGAGWLGKLGLIMLEGRNIFETLLLNLVLTDENGDVWGKAQPCWELDKARTGQRTKIIMPDNQAELLTLQSRRLILQRDGDRISGLKLLGGDFFPKENAVYEQMTLWRNSQDKKNQPPVWTPRRHNANKAMWRELPVVLLANDDEGLNDVRKPGVLEWLGRLKQAELYDRPLTCCKIVAALYGDKDFFVNDSICDALDFHADILTEQFAEEWQNIIVTEVNVAEKTAGIMGALAMDIALASGADRDKVGINCSQKAQQEFYFAVDRPFREWLADIEPQQDESQQKIAVWRRQLWYLALAMGKEIVAAAGQQAYAGKMAENKKEKSGKSHYSAPEAYNRFLGSLSKALNIQEWRKLWDSEN